MSLSSLITGADCGPSNALQSLTKRVDADRGIQQDFFGASRAGSSRQTFRTAVTADPRLNSERASFFNAANRPALPSQVQHGPFDFTAMGQVLNMKDDTSMHSMMPLHHGPEITISGKGKGKMDNWAADFLQEGTFVSPNIDPMIVQTRQMTPQPIQSFHPMNQFMRPEMPFMAMRPPPVMPQTMDSSRVNAARWDEEFLQQHRTLEDTVGQTASNPVQVDGDELSRTAGLLVDSLKDETNPKFQKSAFMGFMRQLRDKEMVVDGDSIVPSSEATTTTTSTSRTENAPSLSSINVPHARERAMTIDDWPMKSVHFDPTIRSVMVDQDQTATTEDIDEADAYWQAENRDYREYWERAAMPPSQAAMSGMKSAQQQEWGQLQESWDAWEATATGVKQTVTPHYPFQTNNPYTFDSLTGASRLQSGRGMDQSLLEREADVLNDPRNAEAWYQLGIQQQSNEREDKAIQALRKAVELDPSLLSAWMELAVSYTNEGNRTEAYVSLLEWIDRNPRYKESVTKWRQGRTFSSPPTAGEITDCLVAMATAIPDGELDPDVQIALGVLLNTTEDYDKARDCFLAALDARPDDHLLYNRIGATMANHGQAQDALAYYHRALAIKPSYIRARFNLGISYISLGRNEEAAELILDALVLQENDGLERGVTSSVLWETLRNVCLHLRRQDLAKLSYKRDLNGFRAAFSSGWDQSPATPV